MEEHRIQNFFFKSIVWFLNIYGFDPDSYLFVFHPFNLIFKAKKRIEDFCKGFHVLHREYIFYNIK